jgi:hypothetical protein
MSSDSNNERNSMLKRFAKSFSSFFAFANNATALARHKCQQ